SGELKCFFERLIFPFLMYDENHTSIFPGKIQTAAIFTMNLNQQFADYLGYEAKFKDVEGQLKIIFGNAEYLVASDTVQFDDYSKYECTCFDGDAKVKRNKEVFPEDCKAAYEMGIRLIERAKAAK
ncbi:MAG: flavodoxin family protein, partial [Oscillospiraceae bacterium]